ncbi:MAG: helix-turn-helix domain-containing protein, partial [Anaerolineales bacterium]|nr:helix-turn-helix domain-containing protein [Anaerolineales bacterium]
MDEIGSILRDAREMKGLTIAEVHENLRISKKYIVALEEGRYEALPSQTHVRGYLNKYARFLGLQADPLLERYEALKQQRPLTPPSPAKDPSIIETPLTLPEPETGTFFAHANFELSNTTSPQSEPDWIGRLIVLALIVAIGLIGWRFLPNLLGEDETLNSENLSTAVLDLLNDDETAAEET